MTGAIIVLLILVIMLFGIATWQAIVLSQTGEKLNYYRSRLLKMVANDTLIEESFEILCEAYNVEQGDLRNYISQYQSKKENDYGH